MTDRVVASVTVDPEDANWLQETAIDQMFCEPHQKSIARLLVALRDSLENDD